MFGLHMQLMSSKGRKIEFNNWEHYSITYPVEPFVQTRGSDFKPKACVLNGTMLFHLH